MLILTKYKLSGEVIESRFIDLKELTQHKNSILGQKARVTTKEGKTYAGFAEEPYYSGEGNNFTLVCYDIDYYTGRLRSSNMTTTFIPIDIIEKIESILNSNPRWGFPPINEFIFSPELKLFIAKYKKLHPKKDEV